MRFLFLFLISTLNGAIVEFHSFQDLSSYLTPETLVVLDIDDTLLIPHQMLGCDEWFMYRLNKKKQTDPRGALEKTLSEWEAVRHLTQMDIVEPNSELIVQGLQRQGYSVMGLTTQGLALATRTTQQLAEKQIDFSLSAPTQEGVYFSNKGHGVLFKNGVLFTSGTPKGEALFRLCKIIGHPIHRIVFVNDKASHLADLEEEAKKQGVEFWGLRYAYSDQRKAAFVPEIAEYQFYYSNFGKILTDEDAMIHLGQHLQSRLETKTRESEQVFLQRSSLGTEGS